MLLFLIEVTFDALLRSALEVVFHKLHLLDLGVVRKVTVGKTHLVINVSLRILAIDSQFLEGSIIRIYQGSE